MMALPPSIILFLGSFALVFLLVLQQHAVHHERYLQAFINALAIGSLNLLAIRMGQLPVVSMFLRSYVAAHPAQ